MSTAKKVHSFCAGLLLLLTLPAMGQSEVDSNGYFLTLSASQPTTLETVQLIATQNSYCHQVLLNAIEIDYGESRIKVSLINSPFDFGGGCVFPREYVFPLGIMSDMDSYQVSVYEEKHGVGGSFYTPEKLLGSLGFTVVEPSTLARGETPAEGSIQSGVGIIRGWACDATLVQVQIDDRPLQAIGYGTSRLDTLEVCGDEDNGYGAVIAWGSLGEGAHRIKTFVDNIEIADVAFQVAGLSDPFIKGLEGSYELSDFPANGHSVIIEWSEPGQNFIITEQNQ